MSEKKNEPIASFPAPQFEPFPLEALWWPTFDPFLFCAHHLDRYPAGGAQMEVASPLLEGRRLGNDFEPKHGFRMYHGHPQPGFPSHPHRGFETISLMRQGFMDHSDSLGAAARFGEGDVQWMTAGGGIVHAEMFPLVYADKPNPTELFQVWLNLPAKHKHVPAHFRMIWSKEIPERLVKDAQGKETRITLIAGAFDQEKVPAPPPHSWAAQPESEVAVWNLRMQPGASVTLPAASAGVTRTLYLFDGQSATVGGQPLPGRHGAHFEADAPVTVVNGGAPAELLMLQGRPIAEPVARYGPFVMNTAEEIQQAYRDYRRTRFGTWPWPNDAPIHPRAQGRFALHADGRREEPKG